MNLKHHLGIAVSMIVTPAYAKTPKSQSEI